MRAPTRRTALVGALAVAVAAAAALAATTASRQHDPPVGGVAAGSPVVTVAGATREVVHEFTAAYTGPVWLTVEVDDGAAHDLVLTWGPWRRWFHQREAGPVTYWFEKKDPESVPLTLELPDGVRAAFGEGALPPGAVDARPGWSRRPAPDPGS